MKVISNQLLWHMNMKWINSLKSNYSLLFIITHRANTIILNYKDTIDSFSKNNDIEDEFKQLQDKVQIEKSASIVEFNSYKKKVEEKEKSLQDQIDRNLKTYQKEIDTQKSNYEQLSKQIDKLAQKQEEIKRAHA